MPASRIRPRARRWRPVIHELAHFYDRAPRGQLSRDPRLLDLAGWQVSPMRLGLRTSHNAFSDRSPDRYELESPVEFVAVNLEYFLLDPAYACRRPALDRFFAAHFGSAPSQAPCAPDFVYLQAGADADLPPLLAARPRPRLRSRIPARRRQRGSR